jgi:LacI family transcriptional regulator
MKRKFKVAVPITLDSPYRVDLVRGIIQFAKQNEQWNLFGQNRVFHNLRDFRRWKGDGIIAYIKSKNEAERLLSLDIPIIDLCAEINFEHDRGSDIAEHYLRRGFTDFAFVGVRQQRWSIERRNGFFAAMPENTPSPRVFLRPKNYWTSFSPKNDLLQWLDERPLTPLAVMAADDQIGAVLIEACQKAKINIPSEVAVVGVNNDIVVCEFCTPPLSSIPFNTIETGFEAARMLQIMMADSSKSSVNELIHVRPQPITLRQSSSYESGRSKAVRDAINFIRANVQKPLSVGDIVNHCGIGRRSLEITFRKLCGHGIYDEIHRQKLKRACVLLQRSNTNITQIAFECGFNSYQRFHALFRKKINSTPKDFRKRYHLESENEQTDK